VSFVGEREVAQLISEGNGTKQVAAALSLSIKTAETHRNNIMRKSASIPSRSWS
jgi:DNA-binding CsgD family transcriptional regulator